MTSFPISNLPHHLMEKIFTKTDTKSNFRLRQTCREVHDLIESSLCITPLVEGSFTIKFIDSSFEFHYKPRSGIVGRNTLADVEGFHGARLEELSFSFADKMPAVDATAFQLLHDSLLKHRITCNDVNLSKGFSKEQLMALLKALKTDKVGFECCKGFRLPGGVNKTITVTRVKAFVVPDVVSAVMKMFLPRFREVQIEVCTVKIESDQRKVHRAVKRALKAILFTPPSTRRLHFYLDGELGASENNLKRAFPKLNWVRKMISCGRFAEEEFTAKVQLPSSFPQGSSYTLTVHNYLIFPRSAYDLYYKAGNSLE